MEVGKLVKWVVILALLVFGWKALAPRIKARLNTKSAATSIDSRADDSCVGRATSASNAWSNGLGRFVNPPYDVEAWSTFKRDVDQRISEADSACTCESESCLKTGGAMRDLRNLVSELDASVRNGSPPSTDFVRAHESIDNALDEARALLREGK